MYVCVCGRERESYYKGGFQAAMTREGAARILGLRERNRKK